MYRVDKDTHLDEQYLLDSSGQAYIFYHRRFMSLYHSISPCYTSYMKLYLPRLDRFLVHNWSLHADRGTSNLYHIFRQLCQWWGRNFQVDTGHVLDRYPRRLGVGLQRKYLHHFHRCRHRWWKQEHSGDLYRDSKLLQDIRGSPRLW